MLDVDGVLAVAPDGRRWDADIEADLGIAPADLQRHVFNARFRECVLGNARLEEQLAAALPAFAPHISPEQLMDYWFSKDARLDHRLLADLAALRSAGMPMYLATVQEHRRADFLWNDLGFSQRFDGCFHSARMGAAKPDPAYFAAVAEAAALTPATLLLIDDSDRNVEAARDAGWRAELWRHGHSRLADILRLHDA